MGVSYYDMSSSEKADYWKKRWSTHNDDVMKYLQSERKLYHEAFHNIINRQKEEYFKSHFKLERAEKFNVEY